MKRLSRSEVIMKSLGLHPLRAKQGYPMLGQGGLKPFKMPEGPVKTLPTRVRRHKPLRGINT